MVGVARRVPGGCSPTTSDFMLIHAMKSAGPKMIVSTRGDAVAIALTLDQARARSRSAPRCRSADLVAHGLLDLGQQQVQRDDLLGVCTFGSMIASRFAAGALDDLDDVAVGPLGGPVVDPHRPGSGRPSRPRSARQRSSCAPGLASGAQASSRSRNTWSAGSVRALSMNFWLEPGTARHDAGTGRRYSSAGGRPGALPRVGRCSRGARLTGWGSCRVEIVTGGARAALRVGRGYVGSSR